MPTSCEQAVDAAVVLQQEAPDDGPGDERHHHRREEQRAEHRSMPRSFWLSSTASSSARLRLSTTSPTEKSAGRAAAPPAAPGRRAAAGSSRAPTNVKVPASTFHSCRQYQNTSASGQQHEDDDADQLRRDEQVAGERVAPRDGPERRCTALVRIVDCCDGHWRSVSAAAGRSARRSACSTASTSASRLSTAVEPGPDGLLQLARSRCGSA